MGLDIDGIIQSIDAFFDDPAGWIIDHVWTPVKDWFTNSDGWFQTNIWKPLGEDFDNIVENIEDFFEDPAGWVDEHIWQPVKDWIGGLWDKIDEKLSPIKKDLSKFFKDLWKSIKDGAKTGLNAVIDVLNGAIDGVNVLLIPLRAVILAVGNLFGAQWTLEDVKIPHIPKLAKGDVVSPGRPYLAMLGDNKRETEVVSPLSTIRQAVREEMGPGANSAEVVSLLRQLLEALEKKELILSPSAKLGRVIDRSQRLYAGVTG